MNIRKYSYPHFAAIIEVLKFLFPWTASLGWCNLEANFPEFLERVFSTNLFFTYDFTLFLNVTEPGSVCIAILRLKFYSVS